MKRLLFITLICALSVIQLPSLSSAGRNGSRGTIEEPRVSVAFQESQTAQTDSNAALDAKPIKVWQSPTHSADANTAPPAKEMSSAKLPKAPLTTLRTAEESEEADEPLSDIDPATLREFKRRAAAPHQDIESAFITNYTAKQDDAGAKANLQTPSANNGLTPSAPNINVTFAGVDDRDQLDGFTFKPPDPDAAAGPNHVMTVVNSLFAIYSKTGTLLQKTGLASWFNITLCSTCKVFDPRITYDPGAGHWIMMTLFKDTGTNQSKVLIAISKTSDPTGGWWNYSLDGVLNYGSEDTWADFPDVGFDGIAASAGGAVYVTVNQFTFGSTPTFRTATVFILPKSALYSGGSVNYWRSWDRKNADNTQAFTYRASKTYGNPGGEFLINTRNSGSTVSLWRINPTYPPTAVDMTLQSTANIGSYAIAPNATQLGTADTIDTDDNRMTKRRLAEQQNLCGLYRCT